MGLTNAQALDMLRSDDLIGIGMDADSLRQRLHPGSVITYQIDRNINYTNVCTEYCSFCAFYRPVSSPEGYVQPLERSEEHTSELQAPCNLVCRLLLEKKKKMFTVIDVHCYQRC